MKQESPEEKSNQEPNEKSRNPTREFVRLLASHIVQKLRSLQETDSQDSKWSGISGSKRLTELGLPNPIAENFIARPIDIKRTFNLQLIPVYWR